MADLQKGEEKRRRAIPNPILFGHTSTVRLYLMRYKSAKYKLHVAIFISDSLTCTMPWRPVQLVALKNHIILNVIPVCLALGLPLRTCICFNYKRSGFIISPENGWLTAYISLMIMEFVIKTMQNAIWPSEIYLIFQ